MKNLFQKTILGLAVLCALALIPSVSYAGEGDWLIRARGIYVAPNESATITTINGNVTINNVVTPELDFTYFMSDNVAAELILATSRHNVNAVGTTLGDVDLGKVSLLPPTLTLQYHVTDMGKMKPYVGAGINLTLFYNKDVATGSAVTDIDYKNKVGFALQAGFDYEIGDNLYFNMDAKRLFLNTDVSLNAGSILADVKINPWVFGIGFAKKF